MEAMKAMSSTAVEDFNVEVQAGHRLIAKLWAAIVEAMDDGVSDEYVKEQLTDVIERVTSLAVKSSRYYLEEVQ